MAVTLYTYALTTLANATAAVGREKGFAAGEEDMLANSINFATAEMERITNRRLAARDYAEVVSPASDTRLRIDGDGDNYLRLSEYPCNTLTSAVYLDDDDTETALDLTGKRIFTETGRVFLPWQTVPEGVGNILVTCNCGYAATAPERYDLERLCLRLTTIIFQDLSKHAGRVTDATLLSSSVRVPDFVMPADVAQGLQAYRRLW
jgi:hypothetical protein